MNKYKANIQILGKIYKSEGKTVCGAISSLKPIGTPKGVGILTILKGKESRSRVLTHPVISRLFALSSTMREIAIKQVSQMFDL